MAQVPENKRQATLMDPSSRMLRAPLLFGRKWIFISSRDGNPGAPVAFGDESNHPKVLCFKRLNLICSPGSLVGVSHTQGLVHLYETTMKKISQDSGWLRFYKDYGCPMLDFCREVGKQTLATILSSGFVYLGFV